MEAGRQSVCLSAVPELPASHLPHWGLGRGDMARQVTQGEGASREWQRQWGRGNNWRGGWVPLLSASQIQGSQLSYCAGRVWKFLLIGSGDIYFL